MQWRHAITSVSVFAGIVGAHFVFRFLYYGAWLPNTYYAKIGGRSWWGMGAAYLGSFAVEYAVLLWLPALILGVLALRKEGRGWLAAIFGAAVLPHALYVVSIGGDHFEYRPLDLYFPFAFLLIGRGLAAAFARRRAWTVAYGAAFLVGLTALPWAAHAEFPATHSTGSESRHVSGRSAAAVAAESSSRRSARLMISPLMASRMRFWRRGSSTPRLTSFCASISARAATSS